MSDEERADGSLRVVYVASNRSCRPCPLREPRQVSVLLHPLVVGNEPLLWYDWSRRHHRRVCMQLLHHQRLDIQQEQGSSASSDLAPAPLSRAQRAHYRLNWSLRLSRNARVPTAGRITLKLFGIPEAVTASLGLATA
jgi:hypothetical protein